MATWTIDNLLSYTTYEEASNVVYAVEYTISHSEGDNSAILKGLWNLDISDLSTFTDYNSLNEETVLGWVKAGLGAEEVTALEFVVDSRVSEKNREGTIVGKAW